MASLYERMWLELNGSLPLSVLKCLGNVPRGVLSICLVDTIYTTECVCCTMYLCMSIVFLTVQLHKGIGIVIVIHRLGKLTIVHEHPHSRKKDGMFNFCFVRDALSPQISLQAFSPSPISGIPGKFRLQSPPTPTITTMLKCRNLLQ